MKPTLIALFALSVAVFADDTNRFQIITHINIDGSLGVMKLDRQTGKTWRYENRVGPEIIISEEGQALRERLGGIIIPRVDNISNFNMEDVILIFKALVKQNDHLQLQKHSPVPKPNIPGGIPGVLPGGLHLNITIIPVGKSVGPGRAARSGGVDPVTGLPMGGGLPGSGGLPGVGGGGIPGVGGVFPSPSMKGITSALHNLSAFSLLHILLNSLDYPVRCIIDRHCIFLMPTGHPFIFLNGKPAETKNKSRWILVGESGG